MTYCEFAGPTPTNVIDTLCVKCGKPLGEHVVPGSQNTAIGYSAKSNGAYNIGIDGYAEIIGESMFVGLGDIDAQFGGWITSREELDAAGLEHYYEIAPNGHRIGKTRPKPTGATHGQEGA